MTASDIHATRPNPFREAMRKGRPLIGIWSMLNSVDATEALGWSGYDWLLVDGEHAPACTHRGARQVKRGRGLADAALLVAEGEDSSGHVGYLQWV